MIDFDDSFRGNTALKAPRKTQVRAARYPGTNAFARQVGEVLDAIDPLINHPPLPETMAFLQSTQ
jgi:hypothetical protein